MKADLKWKWVEALRSGEYEQTQFLLHDAHGFCCLGVLADVQGTDWGTIKAYATDKDGECLEQLSEKFAGGLTKRQQADLARKNDGNEHDGIRRHTFPEIADWIEENIPEES